MEVQPVVEHKSADEPVEGESQSVDEVREEYYPFLRFWGRDDLPFGRKPMRDVCGQVSGLPKLRDVLLHNGGGHPHAFRSGHVRNDFAENMKAWALELDRERMDEQRKKKAWVKKGESLSLYKGGRNYVPPHLPCKLAYSPSAVLMARLGYPHPY